MDHRNGPGHPAAGPRWVQHPRPNPGAGLRLVCLTYSGGRASAFAGLAADLPDGVEVVAIELPGHGRRLTEVPCTRLQPLVDGVVDVLTEQVAPPFVLLGYSMGALLGLEAAREFARRGVRGPSALIVAAATPPHLPTTGPPLHDLPRSDLLAWLAGLDHARTALLENEELVDLILPVLRADLAAGETYLHQPAPPLVCPVAAFGGRADTAVSREALGSWGELTVGGFSATVLDGGHFFLDAPGGAFARALTTELERLFGDLGTRPDLGKEEHAAHGGAR
ncbi:MAG: alpha/beta fold hydrolase [Actinomycetota bacterium]|nr:alpha/beta fold hydrolase [Actinomycetota bacterium]